MTVTVLEEGESGRQKSTLRPPLSVRVLGAAGFSYLGVPGYLRLKLVDGELAATWFYAGDTDGFDTAMKRSGFAVEVGSPLRLHKATELRMGVDFRGQEYWAWEDINLKKKVEAWIRKYA